MAIFRSQLFRKLFIHIIYGNIKTRYNVFGKYANDGLILQTSYASALRLMLGATHLVVFHTTLVEKSSLARLQAGLADSLCVDYLAQVTTHRF